MLNNFNTFSLPNDFNNLANIKYVSGSVDYSASTFKVVANAKDGFAWNDGKTQQTITVKINLDKTDDINLPNNWSNAIGNSNYKNSNWSTLGQMGFNDLSKNYNLKYRGVDNTSPSGTININNARVSYFWINVKPKSGSKWVDGTDGEKAIRIFVFSSLWNDEKNSYSTTDTIANATYQRDNNGLPNSWVSNLLWQTDMFPNLTSKDLQSNVNVTKTKILSDLSQTFRNWNINVSNLLPHSLTNNKTGSQDYDYWNYTITFTNKQTPSITKTINGFMFVRS